MNDYNDASQDPPPGLVGLQNLGNTCYMNGALQALSNCQQLTRFMLDCPASVKTKGLSHSYSELIKQIWEKRNSNFAVPTSIIRNMKCIYPAFRGCSQQDTQEFLRCFLEQLHDELKEPVRKKSIDLSNEDFNSQQPVTTIATMIEEEGDIGDKENINNQNNSSVSININNLIDSNLTNDNDNTINSTITNSSNNSNVSDTNSISITNDTTHDDNLTNNKNTINQNITNNIDEDNNSRSIITDTFEFKISSFVVCSSCNNISTTIETFKDLSIPIPSRDHPYYESFANNDGGDSDVKNDEDEELSGSESSSLSSFEVSDNSGYQNSSKSSHNNNSNRREKATLLGSSNKKDKTDTSKDHKNHSHELQTYHSYPMVVAKWFWNWLGYFRHWFWGPTVTLYDCLSIFFGSDPLEGDNEYSCEVCTKKNRGVKYLKILKLPEVLCIHFKRYESISSSKITTHVSFPLEGLDLASFMCQDAKPQCTTYKLIACICHHGSALLTGHYTTYALNSQDDQWYEFDDQYVTNVEQSQVENSEAYILFYQKDSPDESTTKQRLRASELLKKSLSQDTNKYFISKQWINKFNTFVEPGPITNHDFLCLHDRVPQSRLTYVEELCHPITETVWKYLIDLHGGGPACQEFQVCDICK